MTALGERAAAAAAIVRVCRRLYERGLIAGPDGNVSVRLAGGSVLATPASWSKVDVEPDDLILLDMNGTLLDGNGAASSEIGMHLAAYQARSDVFAVVHAHPPTATGFAVAGQGFVAPVLPEVILQMGEVPVVHYATPGTGEVSRALEPYWSSGCTAVLMANHGATTLGATLTQAHQRMESLEHAARIILTAKLLGRVNELTVTEVAALRRSREGQ